MATAVGMVGIGLMGHGIASNLVKHGHTLAVLEHAGNQPLDALKAAGAQTFQSAAALAARSDVVILVLTGSPQVEAVLTGPGGVALSRPLVRALGCVGDLDGDGTSELAISTSAELVYIYSGAESVTSGLPVRTIPGAPGSGFGLAIAR